MLTVEKRGCFHFLGKMKCFLFPLGDKKDEQRSPKPVSPTSHFSGTSTVSSTGRNSNPSISARENNLREFTISDLKSATRNFSRSVMIGEGGFGCVYWGTIKSLDDPSKKIEVAVKQLGKRGLQARLFFFFFFAQDAARGLTYLHEEMDFQIIFRDFKSSNILLDEDWKAKLSDFGLARLGPSPGSTHVSTGVVGTMGYAAPEYIQTGRLTSKSDVWGYGVFIYELITGRRPLDRNRPKGEQKLLEWVRPYLTDTKRFRLIVDPRLEGKYLIKPVQKLAVVANLCLARNPKTRPKMSEVLEMVTKIVDASSPGNGSKKQLLVPLKSLEASRDEEGKNKRVLDGDDGGWLEKLWNPKNVRAC
ncbi:unnamed protein product [Thlaspi arvense]|uniref:Protein kinase domain-containing protein n=1 Tax=Thlaspi arvense TaxID=13288 RepID=A0AAU9SWD7_THLAR|nr:unnamed protein product [Thlaspi arvense]